MKVKDQEYQEEIGISQLQKMITMVGGLANLSTTEIEMKMASSQPSMPQEKAEKVKDMQAIPHPELVPNQVVKWLSIKRKTKILPKYKPLKLYKEE